MGRLTAFLRLSNRDKGLYLEAIWALLRARQALKKHPFSRIRETLAPDSGEARRVTDGDIETARRVGRAVSVMSRHVPWSAECLVRAFAARRMLQKRGIPSTVCVGVAKETSEVLESHAWLRCGDAVVTGEKGHGRFEIITTFSE